MKTRFIYFSLLCVAFSLKLYAQPRLSVADSTMIEKYRYRLNREVVIDEVSKKDRNNHAVIDSLINESRTRYNQGSVSYSPDKMFKIFVLTGESCGGNCTCINTAYIYLIKEKKTVQADLFPVEKIYKLDDKKYLVIQKGITDAGIYLSDVRAATLLSVNNGKIIFHRIVYSNPVGKSGTADAEPTVSLKLPQYQNIHNGMASNKHILSFDPGTKKLTYSYVADFDHINMNRVYLFSGYFHYENGAFIHKEEKRIKYNDAQ